MGRHVGLKSGISEHVPGLTVNRLCGSGLQAIVNAAQSIMVGDSKLAVAGGTENMSQVPHLNAEIASCKFS
nr:beta-ketoacyl synthase N-terminal-like domain-containing protein [Alkalihalobacillus deserti]